MVDRTASLRWEEPGLPSTLIPQDSRSLLQSCKRPGSQACLLSTPPLLHFQSLGHFLGIRKTPCQIHSNFWLWVQGLALCQLQTRASLYLLELLTALGGSCHSIKLFEFGRDSQSTPGCTGGQCLRRLLGSLRSAVLTLTQPLLAPSSPLPAYSHEELTSSDPFKCFRNSLLTSTARFWWVMNRQTNGTFQGRAGKEKPALNRHS